MWPALYFDTETADYHEEESKALPVQLTAVLAGENRVLNVMSCLISVRHWEGQKFVPIAQRVIDKHNITIEMCDEFGWPADLPLGRFRAMVECAKLVVGHNIAFDISVMDYALSVQKLPAIPWPQSFCTMIESAPICRMPSYGKYSIGGFKAPKLAEAYRFFMGKEMRGAHDALYDTFNTREIHRQILYHKSKAAEPPAEKSSEAEPDQVV